MRGIAPSGDGVTEQVFGVLDGRAIRVAVFGLEGIHVQVAGDDAEHQVDAPLLGRADHFVEHEAIELIIHAPRRAVGVGLPQ